MVALTGDLAKNWVDSSILFIDVVGFSKYDEIKQQEIYNSLHEFIKNELNNYKDVNDYILRSTGDGLLLIILNSKINVLEIARNLQINQVSDIKFRQGLNCGSVLPVNNGTDAIGDPINMCQRIMDCGDSNHILASNHYVATKIGRKPPIENFHNIGEFAVKHGEKVHIYNYFGENFGNQEFPKKLRLLYPQIMSFLIDGSWTCFLECCEVIDLSHELRLENPCSYTSSTSNVIGIEQLSGQSLGIPFLTTKLKNIYMNYGTHIDFPGHIINNEFPANKKISEYDLIKFINEALVIDVRDKLASINPFIGRDGYISWDRVGNMKKLNDKLFSMIDDMEISLSFFKETIEHQKIEDKDLKGKSILFYTGLDKYWKYGQYEPWQYSYFFNPYISKELAEFLVKKRISLIGIDALQIENPLVNLGDREPFFMASNNYKKILKEKLEEIKINFIHKIFLGNDVVIAENLMNLDKLVNKKVLFAIAPLKLNFCTDNSISRAFAMVLKY
jgi:kynurenine formamidase/class 3 adenylate cyclase